MRKLLWVFFITIVFMFPLAIAGGGLFLRPNQQNSEIEQTIVDMSDSVEDESVRDSAVPTITFQWFEGTERKEQKVTGSKIDVGASTLLNNLKSKQMGNCWYDPVAKKIYTGEATFASDTTLYLANTHWLKYHNASGTEYTYMKHYVVTYVSSCVSDSDGYVYYGESATITVKNFPDAAYSSTFLGWSTNKNAAQPDSNYDPNDVITYSHSTGTTYNFSKTIHLYPVFSKQITIKFCDPGGVLLEERTAMSGEKYTLPTIVTEGDRWIYNWTSWTNNSKYYSSGTNVTLWSSTEFHATGPETVAKTFSLTLVNRDANIQTLSFDGEDDRYEDMTEILPTSVSLPDGATSFAGWYTKDGRSNGDWGQEISSDSNIVKYSDHTLYARFNRTVTFNANGGSFEDGSTTTTRVCLENTYPTDFPEVSREYYSYLCWCHTSSGDAKVANEGASGLTDNYGGLSEYARTLYARWRVNTVTLTIKLRHATNIYLQKYEESVVGFSNATAKYDAVESNEIVEGTEKYITTTDLIITNIASGQKFSLSVNARSGFSFMGMSTTDGYPESLTTSLNFSSFSSSQTWYLWFKEETDNEIKYNDEHKYFYFEDGVYPQSYVGDSLNNTLKTEITADKTPDFKLYVGGGERGVYTYNGSKYMQLALPNDFKVTSTSLDGQVYTFSPGEVYYFKLEPIVWRISDCGVDVSEYPTKFADKRTSALSITGVSDIVLDCGAIDLSGSGWKSIIYKDEDPKNTVYWGYRKSELHTNISENYKSLENEFRYARLNTYYFERFNSEEKQVSVVRDYDKNSAGGSVAPYQTGFVQTSVRDFGDITDYRAKASDLVCVLMGINDTDYCGYSTRDLKNLGVGSFITPNGVEASLWLESSTGVRLSYAYTLQSNAANLISGTNFAMLIKGVDNYASEEANSTKIEHIVFDFYSNGIEGTYLVNGNNVIDGMTGVAVAENSSTSIKFFKVGSTAYVLSNKYIMAASNMSYMFVGLKSLKDIQFFNFNTSNTTSMMYVFKDCEALSSVDLSLFDTSKVTSMRGMFYECGNLTFVNFSNFNTSNVTDMSSMFAYSGVEDLDLSGWNTLKVTTTANMFLWCDKMTSFNSFDTRNVKQMNSMFSCCEALENIVLTKFKTDSAVNMRTVFYRCKKLSTIDVSGFNTANATDMSFMFSQCESLIEIDISNFNMGKVTTMDSMFMSCKKIEKIVFGSATNTTKVRDMAGVFGNCINLVTIENLVALDTGAVTSMKSMFYNCASMVSLDLSKFNTANVVDMANMFHSCFSLTSLDLSSFNTSKVETMGGMFAYLGCEENSNNYSGISEIEFGSNFNTSNVKNMSHMFLWYGGTHLDLSGFNTAKVTAMNSMFSCAERLTELDLSSFNTSYVTDMKTMFYRCKSLSSLTLGNGFNTHGVVDMSHMFAYVGANDMFGTLDLSSFDTENVLDMRNMFSYSKIQNIVFFNTLSSSSFDTSKVTNMSNMFAYCANLKSLDLRNFDTSAVTTMAGMFYGCTNMTSVDVSSFDTSNVTTMSSMFYNCRNLASLDVSSFDTSKVKIMNTMFSYFNYYSLEAAGSSISAIILDLSSFNMNNVTSMSSMFAWSGIKRVNFNSEKGTTTNLTNAASMFSCCENLEYVDLSGFNFTRVTSFNSMFWRCKNLTTIVVDSNSNWNSSVSCTSSSMFGNCFKLKGGNGTTWSNSNVNKTYARIDAAGSPGYFTSASAVSGANSDSNITLNNVWSIVGSALSVVVLLGLSVFVLNRKKMSLF